MIPRSSPRQGHAARSGPEERRDSPSFPPFRDGKLVNRSPLMGPDAVNVASTVSARSALAARSTSMSGGAIAGAVVGSIIGVSLIILCILPFILRAIRQRAARRRHGDLVGPEMGMGPNLGGLSGLAPPLQPDSSRRLSREHFAPAVSADQMFAPRPVKEFYVDGSAGSAFREEFSHSPTGTATTQLTQSPVARVQTGLSGDAANKLPSSPAQDGVLPAGPPAEPLENHLAQVQTGATAGDVEAGVDVGVSHGAEHHRFHVGIPSAVKQFAAKTGAALRRSTTHSSSEQRFDAPTRSPTLDQQDQYLASTISAPPIIESYGDDPRGASYSYYHDPEIMNESPTSVSPAQQMPEIIPRLTTAPAMYTMNFASAPAAMPGIPPTEPSAPSSSAYGSPQYTHSPPHISSPQIKQEPSPEDDSTISPGTPIARRDTEIANAAQARSRVQELRTEAAEGEPGVLRTGPHGKIMRMDTLPISGGITADSPTESPGGDLQSPGGINPMVIMAPSNDAEMTHRVKHELDVIAHSPPPQVFTTVVEPSDPVTESSPEQYPEDDGDGRDLDMLDISDYSTPAGFSHSSGPSVQTTPDTRISDTFTASPSPRPPPHEGDFTNGDHPGANPGPASPQRFQCEQCGREFDQIHKLNHHRRYHDRPHECPHRECGMRFGTKTHLARHINDKHDKKRKYYCMVPDCPYSRQGGKSFPRKDNWRRHMTNKHQITPETEPGAEFVDEIMGGV